MICGFVFPGEFKPGQSGSARSSPMPDENGSNLVDKLLGDIRSGFTNKLGENVDFSVTKVTKVRLDGDATPASSSSDRSSPLTPELPPSGEFARQGSLRSSKRGNVVANRLRAIEEGRSESKGKKDSTQEDQKKVRRSAEISEREDLLEYLVQAGEDADSAMFERQGSLRRRRRRNSNLDTLVAERERAPSPALSEETASPRDSLTKPLEKRWRTAMEKNDVDKALAHHYLERRGSRSPVQTYSTGEGRVRSFASDPGESTDRARWSTSSTDTQPENPEDEAARERARRRQERKKRSTLDHLDVRAALHKPFDSEPSTPRVPDVGVTTDPTAASERWAEATKRRGVVKSESDSCVSRSMAAMVTPPEEKQAPPPPEPTHADSSEERTNRQMLRYKSNLDARELASALRTIEEQTRKEQAKAAESPANSVTSTPERTRDRLARKYQSSLEASALNAMIQQVEGTGGGSPQVTTPVSESPRKVASEADQQRRSSPSHGRPVGERRWQSSIERTDVDHVIRSIEKTGREIQLIGSNQNLTNMEDNNGNISPLTRRDSQNNSLNAIDEENRNAPRLNQNDNSPNKSWSGRRWHSHVDRSEVDQALRASNNELDNGPIPVPPPRTTSRARRSGENLADEQLNSSGTSTQRSMSDNGESDKFNSLRARLAGEDKSKQSLTERAWLKHSTGRWKSNIEKSDVDEAFQQLHGGDSSSENTSPSRRPVSTYDNVHSAKTELPSTKRWARYYGDDLKMDQNKPSNSADDGSRLEAPNSTPLSRRWSTLSEYGETDQMGGQSKDTSHLPTLPKTEDAGYYSLDRARLRRTASLRISNLQKTDEAPEVADLLSSKWRRTAESQELDQNVQQFQTRVPETERNRRKERFKSLSKRYTDDDEGPLWTPSSSPHSHGIDSIPEKQLDKSHDMLNEDDQHIKLYNHSQNELNRSEGVLPRIHTTIDSQISPRGLRLPDDSLPKSDTDSVASNKDEGFETESMSDPNASQRTSMSSTLESELTGTPTLGRKDYTKQKPDVLEEPVEESRSSSYFARSIDSLVQRHELATCERSADEADEQLTYTDKTPTTEENRVEIWTQQASDSEGKTVTNTPEDENADDSWTVETVTVERKFSDLTKEEQEAIMASMHVERPPTPPERTTSIKVPSNTSVLKHKASSSPRASITSLRSESSHHTPTKSNTTPTRPPRPGTGTPKAKGSVAAAVTARLTRPKKPSATPAATMLTRAPSNSSVASEASTTSCTSSTSRRSTPSKTKTASSRMSMSSSPSAAVRDRTSSPANRASMVERPASPSPASSPFVRGSATRATLPASVLRTNKRVAAENREKEAPSPPQRSSSIRVSERLHLGRSNSMSRSGDTEHSPAFPGRTSRVAPEAAKPPASSLSRPRRATGLSTGAAGKNDKVSSIITRLSTPTKSRIAAEEETLTKNRPRHLALHNPGSSGSSRPSSGSSSPGSDCGKKDKSPSFLKKIIDKSPYRKSTLNRGLEIKPSPALERKKITVITSTTKSSKC